MLRAYHLSAGVHGHRGGRHSEDFHVEELSAVLPCQMETKETE